MKITVEALVPIYVEVDLVEETIERVVIGDEDSKWTDGGWGDDGLSLDSTLRERAQELADSLEWPSWDFGW